MNYHINVRFHGTIDEVKNHSYDTYPLKRKDPYIGYLYFDTDSFEGQDWTGNCALKVCIGHFDIFSNATWTLSVHNDAINEKLNYTAYSESFGLEISLIFNTSGKNIDSLSKCLSVQAEEWGEATFSIEADDGQPILEVSGH